MKKLGVALCLWAGAVQGVDPSTATFKLHSKWDQSAKHFMGSCLGFMKGSGYYCVTSDHVILNGNQNIEAWVYYSQFGTRFRVLASDWGRGLALVGFHPHEPLKGLPSLNDLAPATPKTGDFVGLWGFPYLNLKLAYLEGLAQPLKSPQNLFAQLPGITPITDAYVEFGMSGGAAFHADTDQFMGIISHQKITQGTTAQTVYLVPASDVFAWLKQYFAGSLSSSVHLKQTLAMQFRSYPVVGTGSLVVEQIGAKGHQADFSLGKSVTPQPFPSPSFDLTRVEQALTRVKGSFSSYRLHGFRRRGEIGGGIATGFSGLPQAFQRLADPKLEPVWLANRNFMDKLSVPLYQAGAVLEREARRTCRTQTQAFAKLCSTVRRLVDRVRKPFGPTDPRHWKVIRPEDPTTVVNSEKFAGDWKALTNKNPGGSQALQRALLEVGLALEDLTL